MPGLYRSAREANLAEVGRGLPVPNIFLSAIEAPEIFHRHTNTWLG